MQSGQVVTGFPIRFAKFPSTQTGRQLGAAPGEACTHAGVAGVRQPWLARAVGVDPNFCPP